MIKSIFKDSVFYFLSKSLVAIINAVFIIVVLNIYGADLYADFSLLLISSLAISNITATWMTQAYLRFGNDSNYQVLRISFFISNILTILIVTAFSVTLDNSETNFIIFLLLTMSQTVYLLGRTVLQKGRKIKNYFIFDLLRMLIISIITFVSIFFYKNIYGLTVAYIIGNFIFCIVIYNVLNDFSALKIGFYYSDVKKWFKFGAPVAFWLTIASLQMLSDRYIIKEFLSLEDSGYYSGYYDLILRSCSLIIMPISNAMYPILIENEGVINTYKKMALRLSLACLIISTVIAVSTNYVLAVFLSMLPSIKLNFDVFFIAIMVFGIVLWQLAMIYQKPLEMQHRTYLMAINVGVVLIISVVINLSFLDMFGILIFPITLSISALIYLFLTYVSVKNDSLPDFIK